MKLTDFANMRSKDILTKLEINQPPFNPFEIASKMGIKVNNDLDWDKISTVKDGTIYPNYEKNTIEIWINPLRPEKRQNFTLAHELGHLVYDILPDYDNFMNKNNDKTYYRNENYGTHETLANNFAAGLLMPIFALKKAISDIQKQSSKKVTLKQYIDGLASMFEVSRDAMVVRLKSLGVISQDYTYPYI